MDSCESSDPLWSKSAHSGDDEGNRVEVAAAWRKSSRSAADEGNRIEMIVQRVEQTPAA